MKSGITRFNYFLDQLQALMLKAEKQKNPGLWLYQNNARTPLFMMEGLAKLYTRLHNKKKFSKIKEQLKVLEDILGAIDYYDCFAKEFSADKKIPANITGYLQAQAREKIQSLNEALTEHGWLGSANKRINKIRKKLDEADWKKDPAEIKMVNRFYNEAIAEIVSFSSRSDFHFSNVEADVHELRRKLRWLSIYPQAMRGCIQLSYRRLRNGQLKTVPKQLQKYLTPAILNSPYNKMPDAAGNKNFLLLEQNYFYALSWMIAELGKLKDSGLRLVAIKEALQQLSPTTESEALLKARQFAGKAQPDLKQVLDKSDAICKVYFKEQNLQKLVIGTAATLP